MTITEAEAQTMKDEWAKGKEEDAAYRIKIGFVQFQPEVRCCWNCATFDHNQDNLECMNYDIRRASSQLALSVCNKFVQRKKELGYRNHERKPRGE